jgi:hypothetical protein
VAFREENQLGLVSKLKDVVHLSRGESARKERDSLGSQKSADDFDQFIRLLEMLDEKTAYARVDGSDGPRVHGQRILK